MSEDMFSVVFVSNYYNHHQKYLSDALYNLTSGNYYFIETAVISSQRLKMGWGGEEKPSYVKQNYFSEESAKECRTLIDNADIVIIGSAPNKLIHNRLKHKKIVFRYSERPLKHGDEIYKFPYRWVMWRLRNYMNKKVYMLCASAYTALDYSKFGLYKNKCFKWGYFPKTEYYGNIEKMIEWKHTASILWVARLIEWKHPELPIAVAKKLKEAGYDFNMNLIGIGKLEKDIKQMIIENDLSDCVHMLGSMKPEQVRKHMEQSSIFMFTSDRNEGWGAVLNEAMNSGCAVVASNAIGSVPFLLKDGDNGSVYKDGDEDDLYNRVKELLDDSKLCARYGLNAYNTITDIWNPEAAAKRFLKLASDMLNGEKNPQLFESGPCSRAEIIKEM